MKKCLLACCLFLCLARASAQEKGPAQRDSLLSVLKLHPKDTHGVNALFGLAEEAYLADPSEAEVFCQRAKEISISIDYTEGQANAYGWLAYLFEQSGRIDSAILYYSSSLELLERSGDKKEQATVLNNIAAIYKDQGRIPEALEYHLRSLQLNEETDDTSGIATSLNNIGLIFLNQGQIQEALGYFNRSLKIYEVAGDRQGVATVFNNIASLYREQGLYEEALEYVQKSLAIVKALNDKYNIAYNFNYIASIYAAQGKRNEALDYYLQGLRLREEIGDKQGMSYSLKNIGSLYEKMGETDKALDFNQKSLAYNEVIGEKSGTSLLLSRLGNLYLRLGQTEKAKRNGERSMALARELGYPLNVRDAAELLGQIYREEGNWQQALLMHDLYVDMRDSIQNEATRQASLKDKFTYEFETKAAVLKAEQDKKDALALEKLNQQKNLRNYFLSGFLLVLTFLVVVFIQRNKLSKEKKRSEDLLLNILPGEIAKELKAKGRSDARMFDEVTVMFTDFKDFTSFAEKLPPHELVAEIDHCFQAFDNIMSKYGIEKIKTIGDSYMAAGGLPVPNATHPADVVFAALEIGQFMQALKQQRILQGREALEIRIGIHTGPVIAGIVGNKKFAYDIWGDTVNTAARMESSSEAGRINISGSTFSLIKNDFPCSYRGKINAKNKGEVDMYFVENKTAAAAFIIPQATAAPL